MNRLARLPRAWLVAAAVGAIVLLVVGTLLLLRTAGPRAAETTDGIQAGQFCFGCHELEAPEQQLTHTGHAGMACTACHEPVTVGERAVVETVDRFGRIVAHAAVPNQRCAACHIDGDPAQWRLVSQSVGHRVHLESDDPTLTGLQCVECHSSSIHKFTVARQTCAQSGCHDDIEVRLGRMGDLTIHCVACHDFSRPVARTAVLGESEATSLRPQQQGCLGCHAMRELTVGMPADEPHDLVCQTCHDPHRQAQPADAARTCATSGCHVRPDTLTPMHVGLAVGVLEGCTGCHAPHDTRVQGHRCLDCHGDIFQDPPSPVGRISAAPRPGLVASLIALVAPQTAQARQQAVQERQQAPSRPLVFSHRPHRGVDCMECHSTATSHGAVTVTSVRECRECHHVTPVAANCNACHRPAEYRGVQRVRQEFRMSVAPAQARLLGFDHASHPNVDCAQCHQSSLTRTANVTCNACHEDHHQPNRSCISCHTRPVDTAHDASAHLGCTAAGCHEPAPVVGVPRTRNLCLSCHQDRVDHEPQGNCADCHALPRPSPRMQPGRTER